MGDRPRQWIRWLPWAEFCYNTSYQASLKTSPFKVVYGRDPPVIRAYEAREARLPAVEQQMLERDEFLAEVRDRLEQAQQYSKQQYDKKHRELSFEVGQWVWLRLLNRPLSSLNVHNRSKLGPRFFGPYKIAEKIGDVAYRSFRRVLACTMSSMLGSSNHFTVLLRWPLQCYLRC